MPVIKISTNMPIDSDQSLALKTQIGALIPIIPGKTEERLMLEFLANQDMYFQGNDEPTSFCQVFLYKEASFEAKNELVAKMTEVLENVIKVPSDRQYHCFSEFENWGRAGCVI